MPALARYYFRLLDGSPCIDEEGIELPDLGAAQAAAVTGARSILCDEVLHGRLPLKERIKITDEAGHAVGSVCFRDVIEIDG